MNRWTSRDKHRQACTVLGIEDYQLKVSRHTYAVRAIRAGAPFEHVAAQLGHADTTMVVRVDARFRPSESERTDWQRIAALQDEAARKAQRFAQFFNLWFTNENGSPIGEPYTFQDND